MRAPNLGCLIRWRSLAEASPRTPTRLNVYDWVRRRPVISDDARVLEEGLPPQSPGPAGNAGMLPRSLRQEVQAAGGAGAVTIEAQ